MTPDEVLRAKKKLAHKIAEAIEREWPNIGMEGFDLDEARELILLELPDSRAEADAEMDLMMRRMNEYPLPDNRPSSIFAQLREALGVPKECPITETIKAAKELAESVILSDREREILQGREDGLIRIGEARPIFRRVFRGLDAKAGS